MKVTFVRLLKIKKLKKLEQKKKNRRKAVTFHRNEVVTHHLGILTTIFLYWVPQKRSRNPSSWHSDYDFSVLALNADAIVDVPQDIADVETSPEKEKWEHAIQEEYKSLMKNETWELVQPQTEMKILDNKPFKRNTSP
ncbi:hypothetical protein QE152_g24530 [Popillia japonica]|uniref:Uncharacterized protein n=1 Tax=Popillia japonica TaxID=7064 RepID=A0AAW1KFJ0_POPJA